MKKKSLSKLETNNSIYWFGRIITDNYTKKIRPARVKKLFKSYSRLPKSVLYEALKLTRIRKDKFGEYYLVSDLVKSFNSLMDQRLVRMLRLHEKQLKKAFRYDWSNQGYDIDRLEIIRWLVTPGKLQDKMLSKYLYTSWELFKKYRFDTKSIVYFCIEELKFGLLYLRFHGESNKPPEELMDEAEDESDYNSSCKFYSRCPMSL